MFKNIKLIIRKVIYTSTFLFDKTFNRMGDKPIILCYHGLKSSSDYDFDVPFSVFSNQIKYLLKNYPKKFLVTFDDGYRDLYKYRNQISELGIKPIIFVLSDPKNANRNELGNNKKLLTLDEIKSLQKLGWEVGLHSATHPDLLNLDTKELTKEILDAKKNLEKNLNKKVKYFSYPKGGYNKAIIKIVKQAGFSRAYAMHSINSSNFTIPRIGVMKNHSFLEFKSMTMPTSSKIRDIFLSNFKFTTV